MDNGYERRGVKITLDKIKVFCMPHAGASASVYYKWEELLNEWKFELIPIEYQGHGIRADEDFYEDFDSMMEDVYEQVVEKLGESSRYVIFGHSMGSYVAFKLEVMLEERLNKGAELLIVSGREAPLFWGTYRKISHFDKDEFMKKIIEFGGIPDEYLSDEAILEYLEPIVHNDFRIIETMNHARKTVKLDTPITVFNGKQDICIPERVACWKNYTKKSCQIYYFEGGHFYINVHYHDICKYIDENVTINVIVNNEV